MTDCRFADKGCSMPAVVRVAMDAGCVYYPDDREQDLCVHHDMKSTPLGSYVVINRRCVRCGCVYEVNEYSTDTHCPECLMKGMP